MNIYVAIDLFLDYHINRNASEHTLRAYSGDLTDLAGYAEGDKITEAENFDTYLLRGFISNLYEEKRSKSTVERKIATFKSFFNFLLANRIISENPAGSLKFPKKDKKLATVFTREGVINLAETPDTSTPLGKRDRLILEILYGTGLRVGELEGLNISDIDMSGKRIRIRGKGKKERSVPIDTFYIDLIKAYLESIPELLQKGYAPECDALIINRRGGRLTSRNILSVVKKYLAKAGLP
ncbi:MAG: tyrosine-type recombinase/integrase, partial [Deferribacteraceae bacterium]|nr:tyrosine-type recombinase/integrase [Deferribacteraceae bacterium]